ncbi:MAG: N-acetylmuramoyl-L-alanine amidase [Methylobacteriaceae bacterium]|nr:N-acetylmuramoyl-L-alanine amidase [Methylobacteriaceae bacterium]
MGEGVALGARATRSRARLAFALASPIIFLAGAGHAAGLIGARAASRSTLTDSVSAAALTDVSATAVRLESTPQSTQLVFDLSGRVEARAFPIANPDRIVIDLPEIAFHVPPLIAGSTLGRRGRGGTLPAASGLVTSYRFGQFAPGHSRVIIDLNAPARIVRAETQPGTEAVPARLVIELAPTDRASFETAASAANVFGLSAKKPQPAAVSTPAASTKPVIVLDPGHGGVDLGASSVHGDIEKNIVLDFATTLAARLESQGRYKVVLTRGSDVFVPLPERVQIARDANAALFVSIHADTLNEGHVQGATVYTVSDRASDAEAGRLADKENQSDAAAGVVGSEDIAEVHDILQDLTRRETRAYSHVFSRTLVSLWKNAGQLNKNPHRSAGFRVLKALDVPSVLFELGYLSNEKDLAGLVSPEWREKAAGTLATAIDSFFAQRNVETATVSPDAIAKVSVPADPATAAR